MSKPIFRFKTKEEFINDFGEGLKKKIHMGWNEAMNEYLGEPIDEKLNLDFMEIWMNANPIFRKTGHFKWYGITKDMITPINYENEKT